MNSAIENPYAILVFDSSLEDATHIGRQLEAEGYTQPCIVTDAREVMPLLLTRCFDLLILGVSPEGGSEMDVLRQIRGRFDCMALPVLLVSEMPSAELRKLVSAHGANDFLNKPLEAAYAAMRIGNLVALSNAVKGKADAENQLEREIASRTAKLDMLIENGLMLSVERDSSRLFQHILEKGQQLLHCDGATMYLVAENQTLQFAQRTKNDLLPTIEIPLHEADGGPNEKFVSAYVAVHNRSILIDDVYAETRFDLSGTRSFDAKCDYHTVSMLTVPMAPRNGEVIGVLQFINALDPATGNPVPFSPDMLVLVEALAAQAAITLDNLQLVEAQRELVENMIQVIATAIDAKSPYTGRHCSRVPELAVMLAETVSDADTGPLADFRFKTEDEWREFRTGAWLHDCGKVTTPEYVIDKATKLETIFNRIHEIRMRFEVLLRDAEIERLTSLASGKAPHDLERAYEVRVKELHDDFKFVALSNIGTERMTDADTARIRKIAANTWLRHFDDRVGLSEAEKVRRAKEPPCTLPVVEHLLADKSEHLVLREASDVPSPSYGFKMDVPEYLYNRGEIHNLCIRRGTLTEEERYKINEHMVFTIMMLEQMKFPKSMRRVPEYAGTHHETLDGTGYPRGLSAEDLSIPARIMAIADVFEAVTASDRPYKRPNKVSEAVKLLYALKCSGKIDADVFDLFLESGLYLTYARKFLEPDQVDDLDITPYLGPVAAQRTCQS